MEIEGKQVRIAIVGPSCVGKTCIVKRFVENAFQGNTYNPTPGVDFAFRRMTVKPMGTATLILLDVGGSAINSKMLGIYLNAGIDIFMLTYDVTNVSSLNEVRTWMEVLQHHKLDKSDKTTLVLIGCKSDLEHLRTVRLDSHSRFAQEYGIPLSFIVSAKSGESVQTCFSNCVVYHLNPEAKNRIREHAIAQGQQSRRGSIVTAAATSGQGGPTHPQSATGGSGLVPPRARALAKAESASRQAQAASSAINDPSSVVCSIQ